MKSKDIIIGGLYAAKVSGYWVSVQVTGQREQEISGKTVFEVINSRTNRRLTMSAARLRYPVKAQQITRPPLPDLETRARMPAFRPGPLRPVDTSMDAAMVPATATASATAMAIARAMASQGEKKGVEAEIITEYELDIHGLANSTAAEKPPR